MRSVLFSLVFLFVSPILAADFSAFQQLLDKHLVEKDLPGGGFESSFNYTQAKKDAGTQQLLNKQAEVLKAFKPQSLQSKDEAIAFWINTYNFFMIKIILDTGFKKGKLNINSVKDFGSLFNPYKIFSRDINNVGGNQMSLDQIEKKTLLGEAYKKRGWKDARVHFAVNCASVGCPPLIKKVYEAKSLNDVLDSNIRKAFKTSRHFSLKGTNLQLTHLFKWYKTDFEEDSGSVQKFLQKYLDANTGAAVDKAKIQFIKYDWNLNRPQNF